MSQKGKRRPHVDSHSDLQSFVRSFTIGAYYDEIEIEDMSWDEEKGVYHYPCPCGDRFENYEDIATCPSCSLIIRVIYDPVRKLSRILVESNIH